MHTFACRLITNDRGQDLVEYALLATVVSLACMLGVEALTGAITNVFATIAGQLE
jgi:Flp pilus assembly pilin Flp